MISRAVKKEAATGRTLLYGIFFLLAFGFEWFSPRGLCKEPSLTAIELYDGSDGAAYLELSDVLINAKAELRDCSGLPGPAIDKSAYGKLPKITIAAGGVLRRDQDGVLRYAATSSAPFVCVVPVNIKFEHSGSFSLAEMADQASMRGTPISPPSGFTGVIPPLKKGVNLVFVSAPNLDLAEYLRAQRASDITGWQAFLARYPTSPHLADSKLALASLYVANGEKSLDAYQRSTTSGSPSYDDLKQAKIQATLAHALVPDLSSVAKLSESIRAKLRIVTDNGRIELGAYHVAVTSHTPGYVHLQNAKHLAEASTGIDADFTPGSVLLKDALKDNSDYETALQTASSAIDAKQVDKAFATVLPYSAFYPEEPRLAALIDAIYKGHMDLGAKAGQSLNWQDSVSEFEKAKKTRDTPEAQDAFVHAKEQLVIARNEAAAKSALNRSKSFEEQNDPIRAYESLSALTSAQQALVSEDMTRLTPAYIQAAVHAAKVLRDAHYPIQGINDGVEIENAYIYLKHAYDLSQDDTYRATMSVLGDELATYFLSQANYFTTKPEGSGTELGWAYIQKALSYKASNQPAVIDARTAAEQAHAMHSRLSIQVQFRDGTSQRDSAGFASQLENGIVTGLEASSLHIKAVRSGQVSSAKPDFQLIGDVIQHYISDPSSVEALESKYRAADSDEINPEWTKSNRELGAAAADVDFRQRALQTALGKGNKKLIADANAKLSLAQKKVQDEQQALDAIPKTIKVQNKRTYTYTRKTIDFKDAIQLQFSIEETLSGKRSPGVRILKEDEKKVPILVNVNAEDTEGVKPIESVPDKNDLLAVLEKSASDALINAVRTSVEALPIQIYEEAHTKELEEDVNGAAEGYLRFISCAPEIDSPERRHAREYLQRQFHFSPDSTVVP
jgi:hypothetical protein